ncbi:MULTISPECIES: ANTAR domain-containing protein [unclassified Arthrobacter]|uniref:ANTAR domain-containing protein n=1 Tax=unclassified Pseudarthrobacter TaxID=2647000 RepID=UPI0033935C3B
MIRTIDDGRSYLVKVNDAGVLDEYLNSAVDLARQYASSTALCGILVTRHALNTRVLIEQAKGVIAHTAGVDMDAAFNLLRSHARANSQSLHTTAGQIVDRSLTLQSRPL